MFILEIGCLRYCKSTIFQANHNGNKLPTMPKKVVCDTAKVRFFKQITTWRWRAAILSKLFAILQKYDFSSKSQPALITSLLTSCCLRYCKSTIFQANHNRKPPCRSCCLLFAILQKYDFSSKSQPFAACLAAKPRCLRYCKSTIFQANHNSYTFGFHAWWLFAILQKYDFSSKSQHEQLGQFEYYGCLRYCKSTIFQANHNWRGGDHGWPTVVCDTAKVRFFKQITTRPISQ